MTEVAGASQVRDEDAFDVAAVAVWLHANADDATGLQGTPEVRQFSGGASNLTYLLRYPTRDLILRRPPAGHKAKSAHDMFREFTIQSRLKPAFPYVPQMIAFCDDDSVIGSDFYVMERLEGIILRRNPPRDFDLSADQVARMCTDALDVLVELHRVDPAAAGLDEIGKGAGYVGRQVKGWSDRYRKAKTWNVGSYGRVMRWLEENQPDDVSICVIHNDFRFDNLVLASPSDEGASMSVIGVLDWEMATLGDPLMDLGGAMAYWIQADDDRVFARFRRQPTHIPGMLTREQVVDCYTSKMGISLTREQWAFYEVFGLFRLAVIAQQIYYRYFHKQTHNRAYKQFHHVVLYLDYRCRKLIREAGRR